MALVYGGHVHSLQQTFAVSAEQIFRIPSLYESWGLEKYLISGKRFSDGMPRLAFVVPPSRQYLQHYAGMLASLPTEVHVTLDLEDQKKYRQDLHQAVKQIRQSVGGDIHYAVLGYTTQWMNTLGRDPQWPVVAKSAIAKAGKGLSGQKLTLQHKISGKQFSVLLLRSDLTIWRESSAFIAEGILQSSISSLKGILFMGSAGGIAAGINVYDVSVPREKLLTARSMW